MKGSENNIYTSPLYQAMNTAVSRVEATDKLKEGSNIEASAIEEAEYREREANERVIELVNSGALAEHDEMFALLISRMGSDIYWDALDKAGDLSPDALGLAVIAALQRRDPAFAIMLVNQNPSVNLKIQNGNGLTPLMAAVAHGSHGFMQYTLIDRSDLEAKDINGQTALMYAVMANDIEALNLLLEYELDLEAKDNNGRTAVMIAVDQGRFDLVDALVTNGAKLDANSIQQDGTTSLMYSVMNKDMKVAEFLIAEGADLEAKNKSGNTAMRVALEMGNVEFVEFLESKGAKLDLEVPNQHGLTPLLSSASMGDIKTVEFLISRGANLEAKDYDGMTPLMHAVTNGDANTVAVLIKAGVDVNAVEGDGLTALAMAAARGDANTVQLLLDSGATVDLLDKENNTPLMYAAINGNVGTINALIKAGADVNAVDHQGKRVLELVNKHSKDAAAMKALITHGADPYVAGLIEEKGGKIVINDKVTDAGMKNVLLGYVKLEQEFKEKFADRIVSGIKDQDIDFYNVDDRINNIIKSVLKEDSKGKFANIIKQSASAPKIELAFIDKFIISLQAILPDSWVESSMDAVKQQLNAAVQKMEVFKPLSTELERELKTFAEKVAKAPAGEVMLGG